MLVRRGMRGVFDLPWRCYIPGYALLSEGTASECNVYGPTPNPPMPRAPVIPVGSESPSQVAAGPVPGESYSVDQVVADTAAAQRQQIADFFSTVGPSDSSSWLSRNWVWLALGGAALYLFGHGRGR